MRASGILMHITSLPGNYGVGTMGREAHRFVDFLKAAGQSCWQILPLTPTGYGDSPYQSCSAFAGNPYLIDLDLLVDQGLLQPEDLSGIQWNESEERVDFGQLYRHRSTVLKKAYDRFTGEAVLDRFCKDNSSWLADFSLFMALKAKFGGKPWYQWDRPLKFRDPKAMWQARQELKDQIRFYSFIQYLFFTQWTALRDYAHENGISIIGDVPIYVPYDSVEVWSSPEYFQLDQELAPTAVAGCPPDAFTADGQLWGNPLYRWDRLAQDGYSWWLVRLGAAGKLYDTIRMDHFRGFQAYWSVPAKDTTARGGKWIEGPGMDFIHAVKEGLPHIRFIAEDLGFLTQEVLDLRDASGYPGMKVLGFAFDSREPSEYLPHTYPRNSVCYTGTHDNMTMRQWFDTADADAVAYATDYMCLTDREGLVWGTIRTAMSSVSDWAIVQMQDLLDLGGFARMNFPGRCDGNNWVWRAKAGAYGPDLARKLRDLTALYCRLPKNKNDKIADDPAI